LIITLVAHWHWQVWLPRGIVSLYDQRCTTAGLRVLYHAVREAVVPWSDPTSISHDSLLPPTWLAVLSRSESRGLWHTRDSDTNAAAINSGRSAVGGGHGDAVGADAHAALFAAVTQSASGVPLLSESSTLPEATGNKRPRRGHALDSSEPDSSWKRVRGSVNVVCSECKQMGHAKGSGLCPLSDQWGRDSEMV
jgi:hypothetical protein